MDDGNCDGLSLGEFDGSQLGQPLGALEGILLDGAPVGKPDGQLDG